MIKRREGSVNLVGDQFHLWVRDSVFLNLYGAHVQEFQTFIAKFNVLLRITFGCPCFKGSVLRAERSAAALRFARNTGGKSA